MDYTKLGDDELNNLIEQKRSEMHTASEQQPSDTRTPSDETLQKSRELDELLNEAQARRSKNV